VTGLGQHEPRRKVIEMLLVHTVGLASACAGRRNLQAWARHQGRVPAQSGDPLEGYRAAPNLNVNLSR